MSQDIPESDWKILRKLHKIALERFCRNVFDKVEQLDTLEPNDLHKRYLALYKLIEDEDREMSIAFDRLSRSNALIHILALYRRNLITEDELAEFTSETQDKVSFIINMG